MHFTILRYTGKRNVKEDNQWNLILTVHFCIYWQFVLPYLFWCNPFFSWSEHVSKNWKIAISPLIFMVVLFLCIPSLAGSVGVLVPVGVLVALAAARFMYKKGWL